MAYVKNQFTRWDVGLNSSTPRAWLYKNTSDTVATITASAYFNSAVVDFSIAVGDPLHIVGSDGSAFVRITAVSPNVTVSTDVSDEDLAEGNIFRGNASGKAAAYDASGNAQILVGNGTTVNSVAMSGRATIDNAGAVTLPLTEGNLLRGDASNEAALLDASTDGQILVGDGTTVNSVAVSGQATMTNTGAVTLAIATNEFLVGNGSGVAVSTPAVDSVSFEVSFETGEIIDHRPYFTIPGTVFRIRAQVTKLIEATDDATITLQQADATPMTGGLLTLTGGSAAATQFGSVVTGNNSFAADTQIHVIAAKTTAGGRARVEIFFSRNTP